MSPAAPPRLAVVWASGCGGCEMAFLDLGDGLAELMETFEIVAFPLLVDTKYDAIAALPDGYLDLCFVSGAVRNCHDLALVRTLRRVAKRLVALGACAQLGSILALADIAPGGDLVRAVYGARDGDGDASGRLPGDTVNAAGNPLRLPGMTPRVLPIDALVEVDYVVPGCPPEAERLGRVVAVLAGCLTAGGHELPPHGSVLGALETALCEECPRDRPLGPVAGMRRLHEVVPDSQRCLLDQALVCSGPVTRGGCGARCPEVGIGCRGCYGPVAGVRDQGARMVGALAALAGETPPLGDDAGRLEVGDSSGGGVADPVGTLYRYSFAPSLLARLAGADSGSRPCDE